MLDDLKQAKAFSAVFDGAPIGICVIELDGRLADANSTLSRMLGFADLEERVITTDLTHPHDVSRSTELFVDLAAGRCESFSLDKRYVRGDGSTAHAHSTALLIRDVDDEPEFVLGLIEPRDEVVHLREGIAEAQTAAHDINNLLTAIFGHQELLLRALPPDDKRRRNVEAIGHVARMSVPIVQTILRRPTRHPESVDVNALILGMRSVAAQLVGSNVKIVLRLDPRIPPVFVERDRLERSIANIAANAHDAMPDGGTLVIETTSEAAFVKILISDTGVGIQPGLRSRIFDRDFSTKPHGHGIGLALASDTVEAVGGFISVDSDFGQGATFTLAFPRRPTAAGSISPEGDDSTHGGAR
jgi:two-component system cell cycle sensor histidine kinase/response regulator CckA